MIVKVGQRVHCSVQHRTVQLQVAHPGSFWIRALLRLMCTGSVRVACPEVLST